MCSSDLMTPQGTFVINGAERVIVSQLHRSPGLAFEATQHANGKMLHSFRIIPDRGSWYEAQFDTSDLLYVYLDRKKRRRKFLTTTFFRALGYGTDAEILNLFYSIKELGVKEAEKLEEIPKTKDKKKYRRARWKALRARIEVSRTIRRIEFTETNKRRLIDEVKESVDAVQRVQRDADGIDRILNPKVKTKGPKLKEEEKKNLLKKQKDIKTHVKGMIDDLEETPQRLRRTIEVIARGEAQAEQAKKELVEDRKSTRLNSSH